MIQPKQLSTRTLPVVAGKQTSYLRTYFLHKAAGRELDAKRMIDDGDIILIEVQTRVVTTSPPRDGYAYVREILLSGESVCSHPRVLEVEPICQIITVIRRGAKAEAGKFRFVLPSCLGSVELLENIREQLVHEMLPNKG